MRTMRSKTTTKKGHENTTEVGDNPPQKVVLGEDPVPSTDTTRLPVVAPVLANKPVHRIQHHTTSTTVVVLPSTTAVPEVVVPITTSGLDTTAEAHAGAEGAPDTMAPSNAEKIEVLQNMVNTGAREGKHQNVVEVENVTTTECFTTPGNIPERGVKRKCFHTTQCPTPSIPALLKCGNTTRAAESDKPACTSSGRVNNKDKTGTQELQSWDLKCEQRRADLEQDQKVSQDNQDNKIQDDHSNKIQDKNLSQENKDNLSNINGSEDNLMPILNSDEIQNSTGSSGNSGTNIRKVECEIRRGGWCEPHSRQARKSWRIVKTWEKLKSGLFGSVTRRRVEYSCEIEFLTSVTENTGPSVILSTNNGVGQGQTAVQNLGLEGPARKIRRRV